MHLNASQTCLMLFGILFNQCLKYEFSPMGVVLLFVELLYVNYDIDL